MGQGLRASSLFAHLYIATSGLELKNIQLEFEKLAWKQGKKKTASIFCNVWEKMWWLPRDDVKPLEITLFRRRRSLSSLKLSWKALCLNPDFFSEASTTKLVYILLLCLQTSRGKVGRVMQDLAHAHTHRRSLKWRWRLVLSAVCMAVERRWGRICRFLSSPRSASLKALSATVPNETSRCVTVDEFSVSFPVIKRNLLERCVSFKTQAELQTIPLVQRPLFSGHAILSLNVQNAQLCPEGVSEWWEGRMK